MGAGAEEKGTIKIKQIFNNWARIAWYCCLSYYRLYTKYIKKVCLKGNKYAQFLFILTYFWGWIMKNIHLCREIAICTFLFIISRLRWAFTCDLPVGAWCWLPVITSGFITLASGRLLCCCSAAMLRLLGLYKLSLHTFTVVWGGELQLYWSHNIKHIWWIIYQFILHIWFGWKSHQSASIHYTAVWHFNGYLPNRQFVFINRWNL